MKIFLKIFFNFKNNYTFALIMIQINKSIIQLNFETQFDKNNRPFRLSGTIRKNDWVTIHRFKRLDDNSFFDIEVNSKGDFLRYVNG